MMVACMGLDFPCCLTRLVISIPAWSMQAKKRTVIRGGITAQVLNEFATSLSYGLIVATSCPFLQGKIGEKSVPT